MAVNLAVAAESLDRMLAALRVAEWYQLTRPHRDAREPGKLRKLKAEDRLILLLGRYWRRQARRIRERLERAAPMVSRFDIRTDAILSQVGDDFWEQEEAELAADLERLLLDAARDGVSLFADASRIGLDYSLTNKEAAKWARGYAFDLIRSVNDTTRAAVRESVAAFVETPGMTLGDVMRRLPFDEVRAQRVAITEITRAYAQGNQLAGEQLAAEFPDVRVVKIWHTNQDERVCLLCEPLDGKVVDIDEQFDTDTDTPPRHIGCRCWHSTTTRIE